MEFQLPGSGEHIAQYRGGISIPQGMSEASSSCFRLYEIGQNDMV